MSEIFRILHLAGIAAAFWMLFGVILVARMYPGYRHAHQAMSELGAKGRPTTKIHPFINNFPIGFLFVVFGASLALENRGGKIVAISGVLIVIHGICHWLTGLFPCDEDMGLASKRSTSQSMHNLAGLLMQLTLFIACAWWVFSTPRELDWFRWLSALCSIVSLAFLIFMFKAFSTGTYIGLYQRISYGALLLWVALFSGIAYIYF